MKAKKLKLLSNPKQIFFEDKTMEQKQVQKNQSTFSTPPPFFLNLYFF